MHTKKYFTLTTFCALVLGVALAAGMSSCAPAVDEVHLGYVLWDSEIASTHVVAAVLEDELGYNVRLTSVDAGPMWAGLARGDFDAMVAAWLPGTHEAYYEQTQDRVVDLGPNLDGAKIGWVVPAYVDVNSIDELNDYVDEFGGEVIGIDPGAGLMAASDEAVEAYELNFNLVEGSDAAMTAALDRAYNREEWIIVTGWIPHWKFASYDLKFLEDPLGVFGDAESIHTIVTPDLQEEAPEAYTFLNNFYWTPEDMGEVMVMIEDGMEPLDAARAWIAENRTTVEQWLP
jgi:glycine betaine/proline transport system substrate-binding protein